MSRFAKTGYFCEFGVLSFREAYRGNRNRANRPKRFWEEMALWRGLWEGLWEEPRTSERTPCVGELVTECTSQRSPGTLSEPLSECHFPLRVAGLVAPNVLRLETLTKNSQNRFNSRICFFLLLVFQETHRIQKSPRFREPTHESALCVWFDSRLPLFGLPKWLVIQACQEFGVSFGEATAPPKFQTDLSFLNFEVDEDADPEWDLKGSAWRC